VHCVRTRLFIFYEKRSQPRKTPTQNVGFGGYLGDRRYKRGSPSYYNIPAGLKSVERVQICVKNLAANSSVGGVPECAAPPFQRVTAVVKLARTEIFSASILRVRKAALLNLTSARPFLFTLFVHAAKALLRPSSLKLGGRWHKWQRRSPNIFRSQLKSTISEHGFFVRAS
jgi:hypothetical protein